MWGFLERVRPTSWLALLLSIAAFELVLLSSHPIYDGPVGEFLDRIDVATDGWIGPMLVFPSLSLALMALVLFGIGELRAEDVGWRKPDLLPAFAITVLFWASSQAVLCLEDAQAGYYASWRWSSEWRGSVLAALCGQVFGNALVEETFYRGLLLPQVFVKTIDRVGRCAALVLATGASLALWTVSHLPMLLRSKHLGGESLCDGLVWTTCFGLILTLAFLVTRNLFLCVGLHSLWNARVTLIVAPLETRESVWWGLTFLLLALWWRWNTRSPVTHVPGLICYRCARSEPSIRRAGQHPRAQSRVVYFRAPLRSPRA